MRITYHLLSNKGSRKINEDRVGSYVKDEEYCFALADGLGGHDKGEVASKIAVETCIDLFKEDGFNEFYIRNAFEESQENILNRQIRDMKPDDYKTTLVLLCIKNGYINWGHIGDSRLYFFKKNKLILHTLDHSVPQMLVNIGEIEDKDITIRLADKERDIKSLKCKERYGVGLLNNGRAITVCKNIAVAASYPLAPVVTVNTTQN